MVSVRIELTMDDSRHTPQTFLFLTIIKLFLAAIAGIVSSFLIKSFTSLFIIFTITVYYILYLVGMNGIEPLSIAYKAIALTIELHSSNILMSVRGFEPPLNRF